MVNWGGSMGVREFVNGEEDIEVDYMIGKSIVCVVVGILVKYGGEKKFVFKE